MAVDTGYRDNVASHGIAESLRTAILDGSYRPGKRIRQEDVAARSGASRIPVREALRMLAAEGLVTLVANSRAWVTRLTMNEALVRGAFPKGGTARAAAATRQHAAAGGGGARPAGRADGGDGGRGHRRG